MTLGDRGMNLDMDGTNSNTLRESSLGEKAFGGGPNSNPKFYLGAEQKRGVFAGVKEFITSYAPAGIAAKAGLEYEKSPELPGKVDFGKEKISGGVARARSMIDDLRGAVQPKIEGAIGGVAERASPALGALRRGAAELRGRQEDPQNLPSSRAHER